MPRFTLSLIAVSLLSTAAATAYPITVTDDTGRRVTLAREPMRIVAMLPSHTETLFAIGAGGKLVGVDVYSNYPAAVAKISKVGSGFEPNIEAIVALRPDLVLVDEGSSSRLAEKLIAAGLTVYGGSAQTYNEVFGKIAVLGKLTNRETNATRLITSLRSELNTLQASVAGLPKVSTYFEVDPTPYAAGPGSFIGALVSKAGGVNILSASLGDFPKISPELVVGASPQVIVGADLADVKARSGWNTIRAVSTGRVYKPTSEQGDTLSRPGPRLPDALRALIRFLHPEAKVAAK
ncbi:ABC transporter substrate-binding protein [Deinococcus sp.]|uniref:ABC transporter substrate-binding protein n=1 Tax=Deinococcus sp. TaxID=47478 RepID=UPI002600CC06|nr:ABC transporter substrate-binding protein [Deinococcus sp.]